VSGESIANSWKSILDKKFPNRVTLFDYPELGSSLDQQAVVINFGGMSEVLATGYGGTEYLHGWIFGCTLYTKGETTAPADVHKLTLQGVDKIITAIEENPLLGKSDGTIRIARIIEISEVIIESIEEAMQELMSCVVSVLVEEDFAVSPNE
jgi:hypothetical protein